MGKKQFFAVAAILLFGSVYGWCSSLSFQLVQHGGGLNNVCPAVLIIEDEILNYFYNAGYIVTNSPAAVSDSESQDEKLWNTAFGDAAYGSFDRFVQIHFYLNETGEKMGNEIDIGGINRLNWKMAAVASGKVLEEGKSNIEKKVGADGEENVRNFASDFASYLQRVLKSRIKEGF